MIDRKNKLLLTAFLMLIAASVVLSYYRFVIKKDFAVFTSPPGESVESGPEEI